MRTSGDFPDCVGAILSPEVRVLRRPGSPSRCEFSPNAKVAYDVTDAAALGIEYYGSLGPVRGFDPPREQRHTIFPVIDLNLGPRWEFNAGVGVGLIPATDRLS